MAATCLLSHRRLPKMRERARRWSKEVKPLTFGRCDSVGIPRNLRYDEKLLLIRILTVLST